MSAIILFEEKQVRRAWDQAGQKWYFAIVDVIAVLSGSPNPQVYWRVMKKRLLDEGNQTVTNCNALKMTAADGKQRLTDVADTEQLLRLIQSIPSPKAEPFKLWLAQVGYERLEIENPELAAKRMLLVPKFHLGTPFGANFYFGSARGREPSPPADTPSARNGISPAEAAAYGTSGGWLHGRAAAFPNGIWERGKKRGVRSRETSPSSPPKSAKPPSA